MTEVFTRTRLPRSRRFAIARADLQSACTRSRRFAIGVALEKTHRLQIGASMYNW